MRTDTPWRSLFLASLALVCSAPAGLAQSLTDVTDQAGLFTIYQPDFMNDLEVNWKVSGGVMVFDADGDGLDDIFWPAGSLAASRLYINQGDGSFDQATSSGLEITAPISMPSFADFDDDGDFDVLLLTYQAFSFEGGPIEDRNFLFQNNGDGTFTDIAETAGLQDLPARAWGASWGDLDNDGRLDLVTISNWHPGTFPEQSSHKMWRNQGDGTFVDKTQRHVLMDGVHGYSPIIVDYDDDGDQDVLAANDHDTSRVFRNDGRWQFTRIDTSIVDGGPLTDSNGMGAAVTDFNHDGIMDWFVTSILWSEPLNWGDATGNRLYLGNGDGTFTDGTLDYGLLDGGWGWGAQIFDLQNDTRLDVAHANGWYMLLLPPPNPLELQFDTLRVFIQDATEQCSDDAAALGVVDIGQGRGMVAFDHDRDGLQDLLVSNNDRGMTLYHADHPAPGGFLEVRLAGTLSNSHGIGAKVAVSHADLPTQTRWITHGSNLLSQSPPAAWFGLDDVTTNVSVRIDWPSGLVSFHKLAPNQYVVIEEPTSGFGVSHLPR